MREEYERELAGQRSVLGWGKGRECVCVSISAGKQRRSMKPWSGERRRDC